MASFLSSKVVRDLKNVNPFLAEEDIDRMMRIVEAMILHANRIVCISTDVGMTRATCSNCFVTFSQPSDKLPDANPQLQRQVTVSESDSALRAGLMQKGESLAAQSNHGAPFRLQSGGGKSPMCLKSGL